MFDLLRSVWDRLTLPADDSPEAKLTACAFTQSEIEAALTVELLDLEDGD